MARPHFWLALVLTTLPTVAAAQGSAPAAPATPAPAAAPATPPAAPATPRAHKRANKAHGPVATLPGFEMQADGSSRIFVEVTQQVEVTEKHAKGKLVYVLKGARVAKRNNRNPLVTVHFNTPVVRARLVPAGADLHVVIDLRKDVAATFKWAAMKDGAAMLQIDFPKGDYLPAGPPPPPPGAGDEGDDGQGGDAKPEPKSQPAPKGPNPG